MLYVVATPIGNLEDITLRALRILKEVDFILCEDTRKTGNLLKRYQIRNKLVSFYEHNEDKKIPKAIEAMQNGQKAALVSSAGTPLLSDPGFKLIRECRKVNLAVTSVPGPSSLTAALSLISIPSDRFIFLGYLPRKKGALRKLFSQIQKQPEALVFFESPYRVVASLEEMKAFFGDRRIAICREMTKKFEEVFEGSFEEAIKRFSQKKPKGEFTLIVSGLL